MAFTTNNFDFKVKKVTPKVTTTPEQSFVVELSRYVYKNEENGFFVASVKVPPEYANVNVNVDGKQLMGRTFTITGTSLFVVENIKEKQEVNITGNFELARDQIQFKTSGVREIIPTKPKAIQVFLASGKIKGVGPATAKKIVDKFGAQTITIFDSDITKLLEIDGITEKKLVNIDKAWKLFRNIYEIMSTMQLYGVGDANGVKIYNHFKEKSLQIIKTDPYKLTEVPMIGFRTADRIAQAIGISHVDPQRIKYCILYTLEKLSEEGHTAFVKEALAARVNEDLTIEPELIDKEIELLIKKEEIILKPLETFMVNVKTKKPTLATYDCVAHKKFHAIESRMAKELFRLSSAQISQSDEDAAAHSQVVDNFLNANTFGLDPSQLSAARVIINNKVSILTGGPGTGKTHTIKSILNFFTQQGKKCVLCAPTGRAAKRMEEATGFKSSTMHRLLGYAEGKFKHDENSPIDADVIIVDESSMIDSYLNYGFLKAIAAKCNVIFVGDIDQLPSVGPGNVLKDLIESGKIAVARLNVIHRQALGSNIIKASHQVIKNEMPSCIEVKSADSDFEFLEFDDNEQIFNSTLELVDTLIKRQEFKKDDIQIISPRKDSACGVDDFNQSLKMLLNFDENFDPKAADKKIRYTAGDRVMQYKNNYELDIFNGDVGKVIDYDEQEMVAIVDFDGRMCEITGQELMDLKLSYAITVHKSQGSDYPCVIIPISKSHTFMWDANLLYTAITRGKKKVYLVGEKKTLFYAIAKFRQNWRTTGLKEEIRKVWGIYEQELLAIQSQKKDSHSVPKFS